MFLGKKKIIIDLTSDSEAVIAEVAVKGNKAEIKNKVKKEYALDNLSSLFLDVKNDFGSKLVSVLIPEKRVSLQILKFPAKKEINKNVVFNELQKITRKKLDKEYFDLAKVLEKDDQVLIQVLSAEKDYLSLIDQGASSAGVVIDVFEPVSFSLARQTTAQETAHIIVYPMKKKAVICIAFAGKVLASASEIKPKIEKRKEKMISLVKQDRDIVVDSSFQEPLDPIVGLAIRSKEKSLGALMIKSRQVFTKKKNQVTKESRIPSADKKEKQPSTPVVKKKKNLSGLKKVALLSLIVLLVAALIFGLSFLYKNAQNKEQDNSSQAELSTPTPAEDTAPTVASIPVVVLERADLVVRVLNGSGTPGVAGIAMEILEDAGYESVSAGNANTYNYEETEISIKSEMEAYLSMLIEDLSADYKIGTSAADLDEDSQYHAVVIIGTE